MEWKCSCKTTNDEHLNKCSNCGRAKPKYFGIKIHFAPNEVFDNKRLAILQLKIGLKFLESGQEKLDRLEKSKQDYKNNDKVPEHIISLRDDLKKSSYQDCKNCYKIINEAEKIESNAGFENEDGINVNSISIRSDCHYLIGSLFFSVNNFEEAVTHFQKSFDLDPNQFSIFKLAQSTINLPVEGKSIFNSKKTDQAKENKRQQEIDLLKLTIKYSPFSELGLLSAKILLEKYNYIISMDDLK
ncbi:MAG: tetratricopeptide repeat protein [Saprospiraceae bacterium]|nr:tetratricopeptide repeat protein [Saprospiraceae bacterium]